MFDERLSSIEDYIVKLIAEEYIHARDKFPGQSSEHGAFAVINEEVDELWDAIKDNKHSTNFDRMKEAVQIAAMAMRYITEHATGDTIDELGRD